MAFVFSCVSGVAGVAVVAWYGLAGGIESDEDSPEATAGVREAREETAISR